MRITPLAAALTLALAAGSVAATTPQDKDKGKAKAAEKPAAKAVAQAPAEKGRDWTQIDTNKDGYISPDEMDVWLKANPGPQK